MHRAVTAGQPLSENHYTSYFIGKISTDFMYMNNSKANTIVKEAMHSPTIVMCTKSYAQTSMKMHHANSICLYISCAIKNGETLICHFHYLLACRAGCAFRSQITI